jgi:hypothetical protein
LLKIGQKAIMSYSISSHAVIEIKSVVGIPVTAFRHELFAGAARHEINFAIRLSRKMWRSSKSAVGVL